MIATYEPGLNGSLVAGVDVGGTKTSVVVIDDRDRILYEHVTPTDRSSLVGQIAGLVDPEDGSVSMAVNLGVTHLPLGSMLQTELVRAALGDATVELLSPTVAPGARGAAAIARHRIGLPEREGVGER
jgi:hypothetical protein